MKTKINRVREGQILIAVGLLIPLILLGITFAFSGYSEPTEGEWFNTSWKYRIKVEFNTTSVNATDWPVELSVNFSDMIDQVRHFDNRSLRVFEYNRSTGRLIHEIPSQFDPELGYNETTNAIGEVVFSANGTTQPHTKRVFYVYWDYLESGTKPLVSYPTNLAYEWNGEIAKVNTSKLEVRVNTNGFGNISGIYYVEDRIAIVPIIVTGDTHADMPAEYLQLFNGTDNVTYDLVGNLTVIPGPVRLTLVQQGQEVAFGNASNKTGLGRIVKKYHLYNRAGPQNKGSFIKISHEFFPVNSEANRSSRAGSVALDVQRSFISQDVASSFLSGEDPYSSAFAIDSSGSVAGIVNANETVSNYSAAYEAALGRLGINLTARQVSVGSSIKQVAMLFFATGGTDGSSEFLEVRNSTRSPVIFNQNNTEKLLVAVVASINQTVFNLNETIVIKGNVSLLTDPYNLTVAINVTLDNGTTTTADDINITLYDDGLAIHRDDIPGDKIFTNNYTFRQDANLTEWSMNLTAYENGSKMLNSTIFRFNVTNKLFVNLTLFNPTGIVNRQILGNVTIQNFARTNGLSGALANCTWNNTIEIFNRTDLNNGTYLINFTAPGVEGAFPVYCSAVLWGNAGNDTEAFSNEPAKTNMTINVSPTVVTIGTVGMIENATFLISVNFSNNATGTAKSGNITLTMLSGWTANTSFEACGIVGVNQSCYKGFNITVPAGTAPGIYRVNLTGRWVNPDDSENITTTYMNVTVTANPKFNITQNNLSGTGADGTSKVVSFFTINSIGNSPAENFTFGCVSGFACTNFNISFLPSSVISLAMGASQNISVIAVIPLNHTPGNFTGIINVTSPNATVPVSVYLNIDILLQNRTNMSLTTDPTSNIVTGVSVTNSVNVSIVTNVTNIGNSSARNVNITYVLPVNWTIAESNQICSNVTYNATCRKSNNFTVPAGTVDGFYNVTVLISWTNLDNSTDTTLYNMSVRVATSPTVAVSSTSIYGALYMNQTKNVLNITVLSVGNSPVLDINFTCASGEVCSNFTPTFEPNFISSMVPGATSNITVNVTVPYMYPAGNYTGLVNVSSSNDGSVIVTLTVEVLANRVWNMTPLSCQRSLFPDEGKVCDVNITNLGNAIINFTVQNITANKTYPNVTTFSIVQGGTYTLSIFYNITGFAQAIYNSTYVIVATQASTPQNFTLNVSLLPATPPTIEIEISHPFTDQGQVETIIANVTDIALTGIARVNISITRPNGTVDRIDMIQISSSGALTRWSISYPNATNLSNPFGNTSSRGLYNITVLSTDNIGNVGNRSTNFTIRYKLGVTAQTLSASYVQGDTGTILYSVRNLSNEGVQGVNVTFRIYDPNSTLLMITNITTDSIGTYHPLPIFSLTDDAPVGTWVLRANSSYFDTILNRPFNIEHNYSFTVQEKTIEVAGLFADIETGVVWYPNNIMMFNMLIYDGQGLPVDPSNFNFTVLDPAQNRYFSIEMNATTKKGIGFYGYNFAMPAGSSTGMYLAILNITRGPLSTMKLKAFRVASGGPYDVRLLLAENEVQQGTPLDFTIIIENKGEVTQDVFIDYNITNVATGLTYYTAAEAVLTPALSNQSFTRSAFIFSGQPLGTYTLKAVVAYDAVQPPINASATFVVISGRNLTPPPPPTPVGGGGGGGPGTGLAAGDQPQPVISVIIEKYSEEIRTYPGFKKIEYVVVRNDGRTALSEVSLSILGIPQSWYTISPASYKTMEPDNSTVFLVEYNIPNDANVGEYKFNLIVTTSQTSAQKSVTLRVLGSVEDLILAEIAALKAALKTLLIDIGVAKNEGKNVNDVLLIVTGIEDSINKAEINYDLGNTQTSLDNIRDAKILLDKARDLLNKLQSTKLEGDFTPLLIGFLLIIVIIVVLFVLRQRNMMPKQLSDTVMQFTHIVEKLRPKKNVEGIEREREKLIRMISVLDKERRDNMITESAYTEMKKSIEAKLIRVDKKR